MKNLKLKIAESMGVDQGSILKIATEGDGVIFQFTKDVRGGWVVDHEENEFVYLNKKYGFQEIYDFIEAKTIKEAISKMRKLNEELKGEE